MDNYKKRQLEFPEMKKCNYEFSGLNGRLRSADESVSWMILQRHSPECIAITQKDKEMESMKEMWRDMENWSWSLTAL